MVIRQVSETQTTRYLRLPMHFDLSALQADLQRLSEQEWAAHYNSGTNGDRWRCQALRSAEGRVNHVLAFSNNAFLDTPLLDRCPYFRYVLDSFKCSTLSVRLMELKAGAAIAEHTDDSTGFEDGLARLHIPIVTHPDVLFWLNDEPIHFSAGETWYMNGNCRHRVENRSKVDRIHLVIDCVPNQWLSDLFYSAGFIANSPPKYGDRSITDDNVLHIISTLRQHNDGTSLALAKRLEDIRNGS